jgi:hypothetical protein
MGITQGVIEIKHFGHIIETGQGAKHVVNVYHYAQSVPNPVFPDPLAVITAWQGRVPAGVLALLHDDYVGDEVKARWLDQTINPETIVQFVNPGLKTGDRLPAYAAVTIQLRTNQRGRSYRGSKHYGPIAEADTTSDQLAVAVQPAWDNVAITLAQALTVSGQVLVPVILSRTKSQVMKDPVTLNAAAITNATLNLTLGTLRRRKEKTVIG